MPPNAEPWYLTADEVVELHLAVMSLIDATAGDVVRDRNLLESALNRPRMAAHYQGADLIQQAATLLWGVVQNHPFHDGNKRTAWVAAETFLNLNGSTITASDEDGFRLMIEVAQCLGVDEVESWLREHTSEGPN